MKGSAPVRVLCAQPRVTWSGLVQTRGETERGVRVSPAQSVKLLPWRGPRLCSALLTCSLLQGCYFCVKQYALECSRIPMGQSVNSQVMALQAQLLLLRVWGSFVGRSGL